MINEGYSQSKSAPNFFSLKSGGSVVITNLRQETTERSADFRREAIRRRFRGFS